VADGRPAIPVRLREQVLEEAGHRCAIPTCRTVPVELAHIVPWAQTREHSFGNLIALCPTCHTRFDRGDISARSMLQYKANLTLLNHRYGDLEQRMLRRFAAGAAAVQLPGAMDLLVEHLLLDGLIAKYEQTSRIFFGDVPALEVYILLPRGAEFIRRMVAADPLD
jgi:hypothetical protein